jgi:predicted house-cleaning noncanonical NTP pyrophosphatase (MazG superfamily)
MQIRLTESRRYSVEDKVHNKLVRDKIPDIIKAKGSVPLTKVLYGGEIADCLKKKLMEETQEFLLSSDIEELVDIYEVILAILNNNKVTFDEFEKMRLSKLEEKGAFKDNIYLIKVQKIEGEISLWEKNHKQG